MSENPELDAITSRIEYLQKMHAEAKQAHAEIIQAIQTHTRNNSFYTPSAAMVQATVRHQAIMATTAARLSAIGVGLEESEIEQTLMLQGEGTEPEGDPFIIIEGGLVDNEPSLPVYDIDVLTSSFVSAQDVDYAIETRERMLNQGHPKLARHIKDLTEFVEDHGDDAQISMLDA